MVDELKMLSAGELLKIVADEASAHPFEGSENQKQAWDEIKRRLIRPTEIPDWVEQYDETAKELLETAEALEGKSGKVSKAHVRKLFRQAADDIKTLVDGLIHEEDKKPKVDENGTVRIPDRFLPKGVSGAGFDPVTLHAHIDALYRTSYPGMHTMEVKPWLIFYLLDRAGL